MLSKSHGTRDLVAPGHEGSWLTLLRLSENTGMPTVSATEAPALEQLNMLNNSSILSFDSTDYQILSFQIEGHNSPVGCGQLCSVC